MNTVTLPYGDWVMVTYALEKFIDEHGINGGSLDCALGNINTQLDNQEY